MLGRMNRSRPAIWGGVVLLGVASVFACTAKQLNGQECLKNFDCESERCLQGFCTAPPGPAPTSAVDSGATVVDTGPADTGPADTGSDSGADTMAAETAADTSGD